jgi:hypothetical protein
MLVEDLNPSAPDCLAASPSSMPFLDPAPIGVGWLAVTAIDSCLQELSMHRCAGRGSRSDSELPPFDPCTAPEQLVRLPKVGHAFTGSPPGWESHPHGCQVIRGPSVDHRGSYPSPCGTWLSANGSHQIDHPAGRQMLSGAAAVQQDLRVAAAGLLEGVGKHRQGGEV